MVKGPLDAAAVGAVVANLLPEDAIVMDEGATAGLALFPMTQGSPKHDWLMLTGGAIGQGLPASVGAAIACPDRKVLALQADGSGMYTVQALWTMARENLDIATVILNNGSYAILNIELARVGVAEPGPKALSLLDLGDPPIDWVSISQGMGVPAVRAETAEALHDALETGAGGTGPPADRGDCQLGPETGRDRQRSMEEQRWLLSNLIPVNSQDYRKIAEKRLPRQLFDYVDGGSYQEVTLDQNIRDFEALQMRQRVMVDVSKIETSATLFDEEYSMPLALAPVGLCGMMARRAEVQAKRAADSMNLPFCLSTVGICSMEEVARVSDRPFWFQLYMLKDRGVVAEILQRAPQPWCQGRWFFTVDLAVMGARYRDTRNGMTGGVGPLGKLRAGPIDYLLHPKWLWDVGINGRPHIFGNLAPYVPGAKSFSDFQMWLATNFDSSVTWKDIKWLRSIWNGNLVIKGVLSPEDAVAAADSGADAVVVSNHGGRQLDGVSSSINMLPRVVDRVGDQLEILIDSGVRSGQDVVKAVALGAKMAMIGRPWVYAVAARGSDGALALLRTFKGEMNTSMALTAVPDLADLSPTVIERLPPESSTSIMPQTNKKAAS